MRLYRLGPRRQRKIIRVRVYLGYGRPVKLRWRNSAWWRAFR